MPVPPEAATAPPGTGVIHDIGYRPYTGPRLGRAHAARALFVQSLRASYGLGRSARSKVLPMLLLGAMCAPALIVVALAVMTRQDELPVDYPGYLANTSILTGIFLAAQAPVMLSRDLRFMTVPLYFSRPLTRTDYVRAKTAAMTAALLVLTALPVVILYAGALLAGMPVGHNTAHALYGLGTALLYSVLYASVGLVVAAATPRRGFGVAAVIGVLIVSTTVAGITWALLDGPGGSGGADWASLLSPSTLVDALSGWVFRLPHQDGPGSVSSGAVGAAALLEFAAVAAACHLLLLRRYRKF
ncbi:ABC transporter permease [Streptacidiphilus sp. ASG 303]|uniref:ABC transporter permease n=1 Tax=Streptacidiphilus sp. ASG 303 TaxID=2896847 RepID=UPI001E404A9B|nr:ABC transporter permease [Streptacidiphilus sp. ASG 303]MCD0482293.1 ABC transporter permease [Streptacidiphilus sp. ASG 303]